MMEQSSAQEFQSCPACAVPCRGVSAPSHVTLRCLACRAVVRQGAGEETRWLYPRRARGHSNLHSSTGLTLDTEDSGAPRAQPAQVDRYRLDGELGRGGAGVVYDAYDPVLDRHVALKVLLRSVAQGASRDRFVAEAQAAASLSHRGIVEVMELGMVDGQPYYTMRKVDGPSLADVLAAHGALPDDEAVRVTAAVARAVAHAHDKGVAHRDLKPANVLMDDEPAVADFGLAKVLGAAGELTASRAVLGTPGYVAPEVARGEEVDWVLADVYGIGAILYATLSGRPPHGQVDPRRRLAAASKGTYTPMMRWRPDLPADLVAILDTALHADAHHRYADATSLAEDLERFGRGEPVRARPPSLGRRGRLWARRRAGLLGVVAVVGVMVGSVMLIPLWMASSAREAREAEARRAWEAIQERMATDPERADMWFRAFAEGEEARGTRVLTQAWLQRGRELPSAPRDWSGTALPNDPALEAFTTALVESPDLDLRVEAIWRAADWARQEGSVAVLHPLMEALEPHLEAIPLATRLALELRHALYAGNVEEATAVWLEARAQEPPMMLDVADPRRIDRLYGTGRATRWRFEHAAQVTPAVGASTQLVGIADGTLHRLGMTPELPKLGALALEGRADAMHTVEPAVGQSGGVVVLENLYVFGERGELEVRMRGDSWTSASVDLDGDGLAERILGTLGRRLLRLPAGPGMAPLPAHPWIDDAGSDVEALEVGDVDGDGDPELVAALGAWKAYDLRILGIEDEGLVPHARHQRNAISAMGLLDDPWGPGMLMVVGEHDMYANARVFGADAPQGPPPALLAKRWLGGEIETVWEWPLPRRSQVRRILHHDLDGDGVEEVLASVDVGGFALTLVLWATQDESFEVSTLAGVTAVGVMAQSGGPPLLLGLDGAERHGTVEPNRTLWVLGDGDAPAPRLQTPSAQGLGPAPEGISAADWELASLLVRAGLLEDAAVALERLARTVSGAASRTASVEAAVRWRQVGRPHRGAETLAAAARLDPTLVPDAVEAFLDGAEPGLALELAAGQELPDALVERLAPWVERRDGVLELTGDVLHPAWRVQEPLALRTAGDGLYVNWMRSNRTLAELPLTWSGGPVALAMDLVATRTDWASTSSLVLELGGMEMKLQSVLAGGGGVCFIRPTCRLGTHGSTFVWTPPRVGAPQDVTIRTRLMWEPQSQSWTCSMRALDLEGAARWTSHPPAVSQPSALRIDDVQGEAGATFRGRIERLEIWGMEPGPADTETLSVGRRRLAERIPDGALAALPEDAWMDRAMVAGLQGRVGRTIAALKQARELEPAAFARSLPFLLRGERETFATPLREVLGDDYAEAYREVWEVALASGGDTEEIDDGLLRDLEGLSRTDDPVVRELLGLRAETLLRLGLTQRGRREAEAWLDEGEGPMEARLRLALGALQCADGRTEQARSQARLALEHTSTPFIVRDRLRADPRWARCLPE